MKNDIVWDDTDIKHIWMGTIAFDIGWRFVEDNRAEYISLTALARKYEKDIKHKCDRLVQFMLRPIISEHSMVDVDMTGTLESDLFPYEILLWMLMGMGDERFVTDTLFGNIKFNENSLKQFLHIVDEQGLGDKFPMTMQLDDDGNYNNSMYEQNVINAYKYASDIADDVILASCDMECIFYTDLLRIIDNYEVIHNIFCTKYIMRVIIDEIRKKRGMFLLVVDGIGDEMSLGVVITAIGVDQFFQMYRNGDIIVDADCYEKFVEMASECIRSTYEERHAKAAKKRLSESESDQQKPKGLPFAWKMFDVDTLFHVSDVVHKVIDGVMVPGKITTYDDDDNVLINYAELSKVIRESSRCMDISAPETFAIFWALYATHEGCNTIIMPITEMYDRIFFSSIVHTFRVEKCVTSKSSAWANKEIEGCYLKDHPVFYRADGMCDDQVHFSFWILTNDDSEVEKEIDILVRYNREHNNPVYKE